MEEKKFTIEKENPQDKEEVLLNELKNRYPNDPHFSAINPNDIFPEDWHLLDKFLKNELTIEALREHQAKLAEWLREKKKVTIDDLKVDSRANFTAVIVNKFVPKK